MAEILGTPVGVMLESMSSLELSKWVAYFKVKNALQQQEYDRMEAKIRMNRR